MMPEKLCTPCSNYSHFYHDYRYLYIKQEASVREGADSGTLIRRQAKGCSTTRAGYRSIAAVVPKGPHPDTKEVFAVPTHEEVREEKAEMEWENNFNDYKPMRSPKKEWRPRKVEKTSEPLEKKEEVQEPTKEKEKAPELTPSDDKMDLLDSPLIKKG
jgi:hypothetical protein